jgi:hypothetical protein
MKGMLASVSIVLTQPDLLLTMNQAIGNPAARSIKETVTAIANEAAIADPPRLKRSGWDNISKIFEPPSKIPKTGGTNTMTRKNSTPIAYAAILALREPEIESRKSTTRLLRLIREPRAGRPISDLSRTSLPLPIRHAPDPR